MESSEQAENGLSPSVGTQLEQARQSKQWTVAYVANCLNLNKNIIENLESDFQCGDKNANPIYYRGYLRSYMRLLGVESSIVLSELPLNEPVSRSRQINSLTDLSAGNHARTSTFRLSRWTLGIVLALVVMVFAWWYQQSHHPSSIIQLPTVQLQQAAVPLPEQKVVAKSGQYTVSPVVSGKATEK